MWEKLLEWMGRCCCKRSTRSESLNKYTSKKAAATATSNWRSWSWIMRAELLHYSQLDEQLLVLIDKRSSEALDKLNRYARARKCAQDSLSGCCVYHSICYVFNGIFMFFLLNFQVELISGAPYTTLSHFNNRIIHASFVLDVCKMNQDENTQGEREIEFDYGSKCYSEPIHSIASQFNNHNRNGKKKKYS